MTDVTAPIVAFASDVLGFPLWPRQAAILEEIYADGVTTAVLRLGRRSGKGRIAAVVATYESTANADLHLANVPAGEQIGMVVVAKNQKQARIVHRFIRAFLQRPAFAGLVVRDTVDEIELANGIVIVTVPCDAAAARGFAAPVVILDEAAHFAGTDGSPLDPREVWDALVPATAQFPHRRVLVLSTPMSASGWFAKLCGDAASGDLPGFRHWHVSTADMNPEIDPTMLELERVRDPIYFRREYEAEFEAGIGTVFDADLVRAAVRATRDLPPLPGIGYVIAADPAYTGDTFTALVGHVERSGRVVVDRVRAWRGSKANPVQIDTTLDELALFAQAYNRAPVLIDQYTAEPIQQGLRARGVDAYVKPWTNDLKIDAVAAVRRTLYAGQLEIPKHRELVDELMAIEQRATPGGRPRIAAPRSGHDDYATALMMLVEELVAPAMPAEQLVYFDPLTGQFTTEVPRGVSVSPY